MNNEASEEQKGLSSELPEARLKEVIEAVGLAMTKGDGGVSLKAIDPDGSTLKVALEKAVNDALAISPLEELMKAWKGLRQVADLIGAKGPEDRKPRHVTIASHTLKASFTPNIVIELGKLVKIRKLPVPVAFNLKIEGLIITVVDRRIVAIAAGRAKPTVTVKVEGVTILKETLPTIDLPLEMKSQVDDEQVAEVG
ncbi:hypothetical protein MUY35_09455 [Aliiroseovarius sp. S1339]|uniref:hypothetical protein n=1 Tax=Aliiroseovarius sp. S1339 TaxID=2936990 RepID=UPI0020BF6F0A|nr:hypothetical protein [Aliiroseovarius sp. S1339]MCK8464075.1 hypothetical protein [Aliiroseovarius sp. S1339]